MPNVDSKASYDIWHDNLAVDEASDAPWHRLIKAHLETIDLVGRRVLEIGCGRGGFACWLAARERGPEQIVAADFSHTALQKAQQFARKRHMPNLHWEVGDIQTISHADESFDLVISCETIEHVPNPRQAVKELSRVLKRSGLLILTTPNYLGTMGLYRMYRRLCGRPFTEEGQPINHFMMLPRTRTMIDSAGLDVKKIDGVGHYLPFPGRPPVELAFLNEPRHLMRWFALHSLTIAQKPASPSNQ